MRVLFVTNYSETSATSLCVWMVAKEFVNRGHHCVICAFEGCVYDSLVDDSPKTLYKSREIKQTFINRLRAYLKEFRPMWLVKRSRRTNELRESVKLKISSFLPEVIVSSLNPIEALIIGKELKQHLDKVLYIPYFLDAIFAKKTLHGMPSWLYRLLSLYREEKLLSNADAIVMMRSAKIIYDRSRLRPFYFSKIKFLDIPFFFPKVTIKNHERSYFPKDQKVIFYAGTMPRSIRDPRYFLNIFTKVSDPQLHLYFAGKTDFLQEIKKYIKNDSRIHLLGILPHNEIIERQCEADFLLNLGNHFQGMMPSKVFEYISVRKPVISTYYFDEDPCIQYLIKYKSSLLINEQDGLESSLISLKSFLLNPQEVLSIDTLDRIYYENKPLTLVKYIEEIAEEVNRER